MADLTVTVVSADEQVWSGQATMVVAKTKEGEIGILAVTSPSWACCPPARCASPPPTGAARHRERGGRLHLRRERHGHHRARAAALA